MKNAKSIQIILRSYAKYYMTRVIIDLILTDKLIPSTLLVTNRYLPYLLSCRCHRLSAARHLARLMAGVAALPLPHRDPERVRFLVLEELAEVAQTAERYRSRLARRLAR